ncbi:glycoside hydrolase family 2 TIM barrel-domain containing protein [Aestuariivivens sediminis]|uniref:glycoside hydrolase family 2 TIM barrel-domain containing protein n=1 Tax=Aestuariivivens sediminis TaxID=2913557 RepID=UPI001F58A316|nr:glycoside hydrolase family 2 TIM barrel-domain containing protein [Aestuariivivens sediminis]
MFELTLKIVTRLYIILLLTIGNPVFGQGFGKSQTLNDWYFHYGDVHLGGRQTLDHSTWEKVHVPHDWSVTFPASPDKASCTGYLPGGIAWYRTNLDIPEDKDGKRLYLYFEGVYRNSEVYINGKWLGKRPSGYGSFIYEISEYVNYGGINVVAVRVDHEEDADSRWYTGSGIYRDVHLVTAAPTHFDLWGVNYTTEIKENKAEIKVTSQLTSTLGSGAFKVKQELVDATGKVVATSAQKVKITSEKKVSSNQILKITNPELWRINNPYLYQLRTTLYQESKIMDTSLTNVGIRSIDFDADKGFALNGNRMKIKGVCLHHDAGVLGAAVPKEVWRERILKLKELGTNGIRTSHNPQATDLYDLCDELGMLVMDEAFDEWEYPKKKWITGWNHGVPQFQGAAKDFREWGKHDLETMVKRDRNHPSIIMWSIGNEVDYPNDPYSHPVLATGAISQHFVKGYLKDHPHADRLGDIAKELVPIVKSIDTSRPVTAALAGVLMSNETAYPGALDIVGYNYTESRYEEDHAKYPNRILYGSETRHDFHAWKTVRDKDFIFGQFIWTGIDYLGEAHAWPSRGFESGLLDFAGNIKPIGYFRQSLWAENPMVYIGTYPVSTNNGLAIDAPDVWDYKDGDLIRVVCYTNTEKVSLYLNGEQIGKNREYDDETGIVYWDVPFIKGELKAVGYRDDVEMVSKTIQTTYRPEYLELEIKQARLKSKNDVAIIEVRAIDANGNLAKKADNEITCIVREDGELLGIENASGNVAENYTDNKHRLLDGRATIYLRATKDKGEIELNVSTPYLPIVHKNVTIE